jgi:putative ABC transport system permease protein
MSLWRHLTRGARALTNPKAAEQDAADEARHYLEEAAASFETAGLSPAQARRRAQLEYGNTAAICEHMRDYGWENALAALFSDLRFAARQLRKSFGFTAVAVLTLALGIGAATAIFSAVYPILFQPLPYPQAGRLLMVWDVYQGARSDVTFHTWREVAARTRSFDATAAFEPWQPAMSGAGQPERFDGQDVTADYFRVLGVRPAIGRDFEEADTRLKGPHIAILSYGLWRRFGGDPAIIGRQIRLDDDLYTIVGIMPSGFENVLSPSAEIWSPAQYNTGNIRELQTGEWGHHLRMLARLKPGVSAQQAGREMNAIAATHVPEFPRAPWAALNHGFIVDSLHDEITRGIRPALLAVLGAVGLVLLIASVNVVNLLLARGAQRRGEFAMRAALGAGWSRLVRQQLGESLLLAVLGGALGILVAQSGVRALIALSPSGLPRLSAIAVNGPVFLLAFALTALIGLVVGLVPAIHIFRGGLIAGIQQNSARSTAGHQSTRRSLVVSEVALAIVLLVSAGLLLRSFDRLFAVWPGFNPSRLLTMQVQINGHRLDRSGARSQFYAQALQAVRRLPGVAAADFTSLLPLSGEAANTYGIHLEDGSGYNISRYVVSPGFLQTMGIALRRGRYLDAHDTADAPPVAVISESLAREAFAGRDPIRQRIHIGPANRPFYTIVGVVDDVKQTALTQSSPRGVYLTSAQSWFVDDAMSLVVRGRDDVSALAPAIKRAIWSVDKDQPIVRVSMVDDLLAATAAERRFTLLVFEAFALAALALAAIGIYGVLAGSVTERMREIGVRAALGASRRDILALVIRQGMALTALGVGIGLAGAAIASRALVSLLFGITRLDPVTHLGVIALAAGVSAVACGLPAWRASRVDPAITLRAV